MNSLERRSSTDDRKSCSAPRWKGSDANEVRLDTSGFRCDARHAPQPAGICQLATHRVITKEETES